MLTAFNIPHSPFTIPHSNELQYRTYNTPYTSSSRGRLSRWLGTGCGCLIGVLVGIILVFLVSSMGVRAIQTIGQLPSGQSSVTVAVQEDYLNTEANKSINGHYATGIDGITLTALQLDVNPNNRIDMRAQFNIAAGFFNFNTSASVSNQISAQNGKIAINMVGQPKIADITVPIDALPFNLSDDITKAVDKVNNDIIAAQLNDVLQANLTGTDLTLDTITTDESSLTLHLKEK
jgi:hypothetical protein